jgi:hypothetical protein
MRFGDSETPPKVKDGTVYVDIKRTFDLNPAGDGALLIIEGEQVDAVAWGKRRSMSRLTLPVGPPLTPSVEARESVDDLYRPGNVVARTAGSTGIGSRHWRYLGSDNASPGKENPPPGPLFMKPFDGARLASRFMLTVVGAEGSNTFQVSQEPKFTSVVWEETVEGSSLAVTGLPPGDYFWRVKTATGWSPTHRFTVLGFDLERMVQEAREAGRTGPASPDLMEGEVLVEQHLVGLRHQLQRKDTTMVCLDGCNEHGDFPWNMAHSSGPVMEGGHKDSYCTRASLAMLASQAGCRLSQDRISYYIFEEAGSASEGARATGEIGNPLGDLGHSEGVLAPDIRLALAWIYRQPANSVRTVSLTPENVDDGDPSDMDSVRDFLADDRPILRSTYGAEWGHTTAVDGYALLRFTDSPSGVAMEEQFIRVLDPWIHDHISWISTLTVAPDTTVTFPPTSGRPNRCDEPEIGRDQDNDSLNDFDESRRLHTDPNNVDTDEDRLRDDDDMRGYLFNLEDGSYNLRERDIDGDGRPKELDPDNDHRNDDGVTDGCEDADRNGFFDPGGRETDNFNSGDDGNVMNPRCTSGFIRLEGTASMGGFPGGDVRVQEEVIIEQGHPWDSDQFVHQHTWEMSGGGISIPVPGRGNITGSSSGSGRGMARVTIKIEPEGRYRMVTDVQPRQGSYAVTASGPGIPSRSSSHPLFFGFGDHHYDYVSSMTPPEVVQALHDSGYPNIFEGTVESPPEGGRVIRGEDRLTLPGSITGGQVTGGTRRTWEIWIELPPEE